MDDCYLELLNKFKVTKLYTDLLRSRDKLVSIDDIHDAILTIGVSMEHPISHYIVKAKQIALNRHSLEKNRDNIVKDNKNVIYTAISGFDYSNLNEYGFTDEELTIVFERLNGIPMARSKVSRRRYRHCLHCIKTKIFNVK